jgi:diguanylate cyclase (GGDEF)-like protein
VLCAVAGRLETAAGRHPVFRLGGDEFAVLVRGSSAATAEAVACIETALPRFELELAGGTVVQSASIGVASTEGAPAHPEDLLREADRAMYEAKPAAPNVRSLRLVARRAG